MIVIKKTNCIIDNVWITNSTTYNVLEKLIWIQQNQYVIHTLSNEVTYENANNYRLNYILTYPIKSIKNCYIKDDDPVTITAEHKCFYNFGFIMMIIIGSIFLCGISIYFYRQHKKEKYNIQPTNV